MLRRSLGGGVIFFFSALYCSCLEFYALLDLRNWNYCLLALPTQEGGNKGSNFKEGGNKDIKNYNSVKKIFSFKQGSKLYWTYFEGKQILRIVATV